MNKEELLKEIMDFYQHDVKIENEKVVVNHPITDGNENNYGLNFVGVKEAEGHFEYDSIDEALKDWVEMIEDFNNNSIVYWSEEKINFIKSL